jgi:hypothetical protein
MDASASREAAPLAIHVELSKEGLWEIRERGSERKTKGRITTSHHKL